MLKKFPTFLYLMVFVAVVGGCMAACKSVRHEVFNGLDSATHWVDTHPVSKEPMKYIGG